MKTEEQTRQEHGERIAERKKQNRPWTLEEMDKIGKVQDLSRRLNSFINVLDTATPLPQS